MSFKDRSLDFLFSLIWFFLFFFITSCLISLPYVIYLNFSDWYNYPAPLWIKIVISLIVIGLILPTNYLMKSYWGVIKSILFFLSGKIKFQDVLAHFDFTKE